MSQDRSRSRVLLITAAGIAVALVATGLLARREARAALEARTARAAVPVVAVVRGTAPKAGEPLVLPGSVQASRETRVHARSDGYVRRLHVDIGSRVRAGQLLAELDTPELDEQLREARAERETRRANHEIARSTADRWQQLVERQLVAKQGAEEKVAEEKARRTALDAAAANVERLERLAGFKRVVAPFDGIVTDRRVEAGQLVDAGGGGVELFRIAGDGALRITVFVPQGIAARIAPGVAASVALPERPGERVPAKVVRTSGAIDAATRTLRAELEAVDPKRLILPGAYAEVRFELPLEGGALRLPVSTLLFRGGGTMLAVVSAQDRVELRRITVGRDFGTEFEVLEGLNPADDVVDNPPDSLLDGQAVRRAAN